MFTLSFDYVSHFQHTLTLAESSWNGAENYRLESKCYMHETLRKNHLSLNEMGK